MAEGQGYTSVEPYNTDIIQISVQDIEEELGPLLTRKEAILTSESRPATIGKWINEEKLQLLGALSITEVEAATEPHIKVMVEKNIRYRVCVRLLRMYDANRKTIGLTSYRASIVEYRNEQEDMENYIMEWFNPMVRGREDDKTQPLTAAGVARETNRQKGKQYKGRGFTDNGQGIF